MKVPQSGLRIDSPSWPLLQALISYWGITDADGNVGGTTIRCGNLALEPPYANHALKILSGPAAGQIRDITTHPAGTDTVTVVEAFSNVAGVPQQITAGTLFVILSSTPTVAEVAAVLASLTGKPNVHDVVIYPVAEDAGVTELVDDGSSPAFYPAVAASTNAVGEGAAVAAWTEDINFEQEGTINVISIYAEFEWQTRFLIGAGNGVNSVSKIQISRDGGATFVDLTENFINPNAAMTARNREGVGLWIPTIVAGANQLQLRLVHWVDAGNGISTSEAQIRSNSFIRITYRKS